MSVSTQTNSEVPSIPLYRLKEIHDLREIEGQGRKVFIELTEDEIYPSQHENEMGESYLHYIIGSYLWNAINLFFNERSDVFVAANLNLYHDENNPQQWFAPDIFVAFGVENHQPRSYKLWEEKVFPQVVFEIASDATYKNDISDKVALYEKLGAEEYYIVDSERFLPTPLIAFRRDKNDALKLMYLSENRVFSPRLGLEIIHTGADVKLFNLITQKFLPNLAEAAAKAEKFDEVAAKAEKFDEAQAEIERLKAELAKLKSEN